MTIYVGYLAENSSGYSQAGYNYLMALQQNAHKFSLYPISGFVNWRLAPHWTAPLSEWTGELGIPRDVALLHHCPDMIPSLPIVAKKTIAITTLETSIVPKWIIKTLNESSLSVVCFPSQFNDDVFKSSGLTKPTAVIPHTIGPWWWEDAPSLAPDPQRPYTFAYVGTWNSRKNPEGIVRAYLDAFPKETGETCLLIKTYVGASVNTYINDMIANRSDIFIYNEMFNENQVKWFHLMADSYVSAHRGEGFGLGLLQAKLLGKRVIYTNWSAPTEFCSSEMGDSPLEYEITDVKGMDEKHNHFRTFETIQWAEPSHNHLVETMISHARTGRRDPSTLAWLNDYRQKYSWKTVGAQLDSLIKEVA